MPERTGYCPIKNGPCTIRIRVPIPIYCYVAIPFKEEWTDTRTTIINVLNKLGVKPWIADEEITPGRDILCKICERITNCRFAIVEITELNPNVMFEFGMILGRRKPVFILFNKSLSHRARERLPTDISALERIEYFNQEELARKLELGISNYLGRFPHIKNLIRDFKFTQAHHLVNDMFIQIRKQGTLYDFASSLEDICQEIWSLYERTQQENLLIEYIKFKIYISKTFIMVGDLEEALSCIHDVLNIMRTSAKNSFMVDFSKLDKNYCERITKLIQNNILFELPPSDIEVISYLSDLSLTSLTKFYSYLSYSGRKLPKKLIEQIGNYVQNMLFIATLPSPGEVDLTYRADVEYSVILYMGWLYAVKDAIHFDDESRELAHNYIKLFEKSLREYYKKLNNIFSASLEGKNT